MESKTSVFRDEFLPYIIKWGRGLNLFGVANPRKLSPALRIGENNV